MGQTSKVLSKIAWATEALLLWLALLLSAAAFAGIRIKKILAPIRTEEVLLSPPLAGPRTPQEWFECTWFRFVLQKSTSITVIERVFNKASYAEQTWATGSTSFADENIAVSLSHHLFATTKLRRCIILDSIHSEIPSTKAPQECRQWLQDSWEMFAREDWSTSNMCRLNFEGQQYWMIPDKTGWWRRTKDIWMLKKLYWLRIGSKLNQRGRGKVGRKSRRSRLATSSARPRNLLTVCDEIK